MAQSHILAIDQGTTGTTALVFDSKAQLAGRAYKEFKQHYPKPGWVEHDAEEIWRVSVEVAQIALDSAKITPSRVAALGITNQRETTLLWDRKSGKPISKAIVWQCRRTTDRCEELRKAGLEKTVREKTGLVVDPYFSGTKIAWLLDHVEGARKKAENGELAFGTIDSWLIWNLTGGKKHVTDYTNASRTLLFDIHKKEWSNDLCKMLHIPTSVLPEVLPSAGSFGTSGSEWLGNSVPICGVAGDQQAALYGHYAVQEKQAKCTFGTGAFAVAYCGEKAILSKHGLLTTLACNAKGGPAYALEGSIFMAGAIIQWLRDELGLLTKAPDSEKIAQSVTDTGGVYLVPAFVGLGAPYWDSEARAAIVGMTRGTNRAHIVRAALEAIVYQTADLVDAMADDMGGRLTELRVDGGAVANNFLLQYLADLLELPILRPTLFEMTGFGAARLAAVANGTWSEETRPPDHPTCYAPNMPGTQRTRLKEGWKEAIARVRSASRR